MLSQSIVPGLQFTILIGMNVSLRRVDEGQHSMAVDIPLSVEAMHELE